MDDDSWNYFARDRHYVEVLKSRLSQGIEMDSARALAGYMQKHFQGDLKLLDFGSGPGHYYPVIRRLYTNGSIHYQGVDIDEESIRYGAAYFRDDPACDFSVGSALDPFQFAGDANCIISANTLPHIPTIRPIFELLSNSGKIDRFIFRMLLGEECVQIKKHLSNNYFNGMFESNYQFNNIYSLAYLRELAGASWILEVEQDLFDPARLEQHRVPAQETDDFYSNRVTRSVGSLLFKGEIYMPWKFVIGHKKRS